MFCAPRILWEDSSDAEPLIFCFRVRAAGFAASVGSWCLTEYALRQGTSFSLEAHRDLFIRVGLAFHRATESSESSGVKALRTGNRDWAIALLN